MAAKKKSLNGCVIEGCSNKARSRGLCESCYRQARRMIQEGTATGWPSLIAQGLAKDTRSPFRAAAERVKKSRTRAKAS